MRWLDRLKGMFGGMAQNPARPSSGADAVSDKPVTLQSLIQADLRRSNAIFPGLGDSAVHYVLNGGPRDVLVRLSGSGAGRRIEHESTGTFSESIAFGRCYVLGTMLATDPGLCAR